MVPSPGGTAVRAARVPVVHLEVMAGTEPMVVPGIRMGAPVAELAPEVVAMARVKVVLVETAAALLETETVAAEEPVRWGAAELITPRGLVETVVRAALAVTQATAQATAMAEAVVRQGLVGSATTAMAERVEPAAMAVTRREAGRAAPEGQGATLGSPIAAAPVLLALVGTAALAPPVVPVAPQMAVLAPARAVRLLAVLDVQMEEGFRGGQLVSSSESLALSLLSASAEPKRRSVSGGVEEFFFETPSVNPPPCKS